MVVEMEEEETTAIALEHLVISRGATMRPLQVPLILFRNFLDV